MDECRPSTFSMEGVVLDPPRNHSEYDLLFKLVIVGNSGVGKSSLVSRFADDKFEPSYISTIGVDFLVKTLKLGDKLVKLQIWDTAGQDRFQSIVSSYYRGAHGILLVYDCTDPGSVEALETHWMRQVQAYSRPGGVPVLVVGNKADLVDAAAKKKGEPGHGGLVLHDARPAALEFARLHGLAHITTSACVGTGVPETFVGLARLLMAAGIGTSTSVLGRGGSGNGTGSGIHHGHVPGIAVPTVSTTHCCRMS